VNQAIAVGLEVEALAGCIGRNEDANRMIGWIGIEGALDVLAFIGRR
jgi:hypothetical protein